MDKTENRIGSCERKGAITDEQAEELLKTEKETVYSYYPYHGGNWTYPYRWNPYPYVHLLRDNCKSTFTLFRDIDFDQRQHHRNLATMLVLLIRQSDEAHC